MIQICGSFQVRVIMTKSHMIEFLFMINELQNKKINCHNYGFSFTVPCHETRLEYNWAQETIQLATAQGSVCRTMPWLPTVQEASSRQQYTVKINNNMCYSCDVALFNAENPKTSFVVGQQRQQHACLTTSSSHPPSPMRCVLCCCCWQRTRQEQ